MKTAIVTGASKGIGKSITEYLLKNHYQVYGLCRSPCFELQQNFHFISVDFTDASALEKTAKNLIKNLTQLDVLILAAGYGAFKELEQFSVLQMQQLMNVNFLNQAVLTKYCLPLLKQTPGSKLIAIGSEAALAGAKKGSMYCASKFALRGFMQSLRTECNSADVAVTLINPGFVDTDFFNQLNFKPGAEKNHKIQPEQIATTLAMVLNMENNCVLEEINLQPLSKVIVKQS